MFVPYLLVGRLWTIDHMYSQLLLLFGIPSGILTQKNALIYQNEKNISRESCNDILLIHSL